MKSKMDIRLQSVRMTWDYADAVAWLDYCRLQSTLSLMTADRRTEECNIQMVLLN